MSRAFVKEDIDIPERITRRRSASGLPPGALNFMTADGAEQLHLRLADLKFSGADEEEVAELDETLNSATIVERPERPEAVVFGVRVTVKSMTDELHSYRIVGVDEVQLVSELQGCTPLVTLR